MKHATVLWMNKEESLHESFANNAYATAREANEESSETLWKI
jgi:hypothetical protein